MRAWLVCLVALALTACAGALPGPGAQDLGPPLMRFAAEGRISLSQGAQRDHLHFHWEHDAGSDIVLLSSPLGQGLAELSRDASGARLKRPNQAPVAADTLPQLAQRVFGIPLPLDAMADWMRGAHAALEGDIEGWRVVVSETSASGQRRLLRVLNASRDDVEFKLVVDEWDVPE